MTLCFMRKLHFLAVLLLFACSPKFKIQTDMPFPGDYASYQSFKFYNPENMPASNFSFEDGDKQVIFDAVANELKIRGYKSIQGADLMIKIQGGTMSTLEIKNDDRYYPYGYNQYGNYNSYNSYNRYNDHYNRPRDESKKEISIIIDIIDIDRDKIIWQGVGIGELGKNETLSEMKIREAITSIFAEYPHKAGGAN